jgi:hypothetical protein
MPTLRAILEPNIGLVRTERLLRILQIPAGILE